MTSTMPALLCGLMLAAAPGGHGAWAGGDCAGTVPALTIAQAAAPGRSQEQAKPPAPARSPTDPRQPGEPQAAGQPPTEGHAPPAIPPSEQTPGTSGQPARSTPPKN